MATDTTTARRSDGATETPRRYRLRQEQPDIYLFAQMRDTIATADAEFFAILERVKALDWNLFDALEMAHNAAITEITEASFLAGVQIGREPWPMFLESVSVAQPG